MEKMASYVIRTSYIIYKVSLCGTGVVDICLILEVPFKMNKLLDRKELWVS